MATFKKMTMQKMAKAPAKKMTRMNGVMPSKGKMGGNMMGGKMASKKMSAKAKFLKAMR